MFSMNHRSFILTCKRNHEAVFSQTTFFSQSPKQMIVHAPVEITWQHVLWRHRHFRFQFRLSAYHGYWGRVSRLIAGNIEGTVRHGSLKPWRLHLGRKLPRCHFLLQGLSSLTQIKKVYRKVLQAALFSSFHL